MPHSDNCSTRDGSLICDCGNEDHLWPDALIEHQLMISGGRDISLALMYRQIKLLQRLVELTEKLVPQSKKAATTE